MRFDWDPAKNDQLKAERGISFEEIALLLGNGHLWAISKHWNTRKHPTQRVFLVPVEGYIYAVPFVKEGDVIFLKTAFPSRKLTKQYQLEQKQHEKE
ncbi:MAG: BrnT family toxin [Verrucomicrobiota bacterium]|nr:BrnT family toxin [Verrucomicrobiota bacterium]MDP6752887.1 BrnT family toxin [Verrucomicrobiota bacterium]MDP7012990.1 BrnT family toxin [Verrucomicrobiota bacterium]